MNVTLSGQNMLDFFTELEKRGECWELRPKSMNNLSITFEVWMDANPSNYVVTLYRSGSCVMEMEVSV